MHKKIATEKSHKEAVHAPDHRAGGEERQRPQAAVVAIVIKRKLYPQSFHKQEKTKTGSGPKNMAGSG